MTSMRREMDRLRVIRSLNRKAGATRGAITRAQHRAERMAEATDNETLAERRARLESWLEFAAPRPQLAEQAAELRAALDELPPPGVCDSWRWRDFKGLVAP